MSQTPSPLRLLDLATSYQRSSVLLALIELGVPALLADGCCTVVRVAERLAADPLATDRFLNACVALGLLEREGEEYRNAPDVQRFLVSGRPGYLGDAFRRYDRSSYPAWSTLAERLRTWRPATDGVAPALARPSHGANDDHHELALLAGEALASTVELAQHRRLLDLGGGTGAMSIALCRRFRQLRAIVLELPEIAPLARSSIRDAGLDARIEVQEGDLATDPLPGGCDVVLLADLLSIATPRANQMLLKRIFAHLPAGGLVLLSGWILDDDRTGPLLPVLFCLEDINWGAPDVERSAGTYVSWLAAAGFVDNRRTMYFPPTSVIVGLKP